MTRPTFSFRDLCILPQGCSCVSDPATPANQSLLRSGSSSLLPTSVRPSCFCWLSYFCLRLDCAAALFWPWLVSLGSACLGLQFSVTRLDILLTETWVLRVTYFMLPILAFLC